MLLGNSNCLGFIELAASINMSIALSFNFLGGFKPEVLAGVLLDLLLLNWGAMV